MELQCIQPGQSLPLARHEVTLCQDSKPGEEALQSRGNDAELHRSNAADGMEAVAAAASAETGDFVGASGGDDGAASVQLSAVVGGRPLGSPVAVGARRAHSPDGVGSWKVVPSREPSVSITVSEWDNDVGRAEGSPAGCEEEEEGLGEAALEETEDAGQEDAAVVQPQGSGEEPQAAEQDEGSAPHRMKAVGSNNDGTSRPLSVPKGYEGYDLSAAQSPVGDAMGSPSEEEGPMASADALQGSAAMAEALATTPLMSSSVVQEDLVSTSLPPPPPPLPVPRQSTKSVRVDDRVFFVIGGVVSLQVSMELAPAAGAVVPSASVEGFFPLAAGLSSGPPAAAADAPHSAAEPGLLQTLVPGGTFSAALLLHLLAEREVVAATAAVAELGCFTQKLFAAMGPSPSSAATPAAAELLCVPQSLYDTVVAGGGGGGGKMQAADEDSLRRTLSRSSWWGLCEPSSLAEHMKSKCTSQEYVQVRHSMECVWSGSWEIRLGTSASGPLGVWGEGEVRGRFPASRLPNFVPDGIPPTLS